MYISLHVTLLSSRSLEAHIFKVCGANDAITSRRHVFTHPRSFFWLSDRRAGYLKSRTVSQHTAIIGIYVSMVVDYYIFVLCAASIRILTRPNAHKNAKKKTASRSTRLFIILCISLRPFVLGKRWFVEFFVCCVVA